MNNTELNLKNESNINEAKYMASRSDAMLEWSLNQAYEMNHAENILRYETEIARRAIAQFARNIA